MKFPKQINTIKPSIHHQTQKNEKKKKMIIQGTSLKRSSQPEKRYVEWE